MDTPFVFNRPVTGRSFIGRKTEVPILANLLREGENVVMYEPPKAGKDSLLQQVFYDMKLSSMQFGTACAEAWILVLIVLFFTAVQFVGQKKWVHY